MSTNIPSVAHLQSPLPTHIRPSVSVPLISLESPVTCSPHVTTPSPARSLNSTATLALTPPQAYNISTAYSSTPQVAPKDFIHVALTPPNPLRPSLVAFTDFDSRTLIENVGSPENMPTKLPHIETTVQEIPLPSNLSEEAKHFIDSTVRVTLVKAFEIESSTRNQSCNGEWFKLRQCRLTNCNFGNVLKRKKNRLHKTG